MHISQTPLKEKVGAPWEVPRGWGPQGRPVSSSGFGGTPLPPVLVVVGTFSVGAAVKIPALELSRDKATQQWKPGLGFRRDTKAAASGVSPEPALRVQQYSSLKEEKGHHNPTYPGDTFKALSKCYSGPGWI